MDDGDVSCAACIYTRDGERRIHGTADELRELYENVGSRKARGCSRFARYNNLVHKICAQTRPGFDLPWDFADIGNKREVWFASGQLCFMEYTPRLVDNENRVQPVFRAIGFKLKIPKIVFGERSTNERASHNFKKRTDSTKERIDIHSRRGKTGIEKKKTL